jgi:hypothetical protein
LDIFAPSRVIMPWVKSALKGSLRLHQVEVRQRLHEEARVHQVQDRVLDAADVLIDRHPAVEDLRVPGGVVVAGVRVAQVVPGGVDERVHRVRLAPGRAAADRARGVDPVSADASGERPCGAKSSMSGSSTGRSASGTGTMPCSSQ